MSATRDPRIDPLPGDLLRKGQIWLMVLETDLSWVGLVRAEKRDGEWWGCFSTRRIPWPEYRQTAVDVDEVIPAESEVPA